MYRLLFIADPATGKDAANWQAEGYGPVDVNADLDAALRLHREKAYHAIAADTEACLAELRKRLDDQADGTPSFLMPADPEERLTVLQDVRHLLNRLYADNTDEQFPLNELSHRIQEDMIHNLLYGTHSHPQRIRRWFAMLRSDVPIDTACRLYTLILPQGDLYLADHWHHGQRRLERALEQTFFGQIPGMYCSVVFRSPVEMRLVLVPDRPLAGEALAAAVDSAVSRTVEDIKSYLDLDVDVQQAQSYACLTDCVTEPNV